MPKKLLVTVTDDTPDFDSNTLQDYHYDQIIPSDLPTDIIELIVWGILYDRGWCIGTDYTWKLEDTHVPIS